MPRIVRASAGLFLGAALSLLAGTALAQTPDQEVVFPRVTVMSFGDDTVNGDLSKASLTDIQARPPGRLASLIRPRTSFRGEILRSSR